MNISLKIKCISEYHSKLFRKKENLITNNFLRGNNSKKY